MACLVRWYDFLQHTADPTGIYPRVLVPVPPLRLPVPSAAAPRVRSLIQSGKAAQVLPDAISEIMSKCVAAKPMPS